MALRVKIIATDKLSGTLLGIGKNVMRLGVKFAKMGVLAAAAISAIAIKLQSDLDIGLREIGTLMDGLTDKQIKGMTRELETLAQRWGQSMKVLTKTKYDIISAGFSTAAESALLLEKTAILATAGVTDMATAGDLLTTALNAYGKSAKDAEHFSDVLFHTVKKGKTTIGALGGSMGRIFGIAASVGFGFEEVSAALATLTLSLGSTEMATTAINGAILGLLKPSEELEGLIKKTEYASLDAMIAALGFSDTLALLKETADANKMPMKDLFGNIRGLMAILPLTSTQQKQFNDILASYTGIAGTATRASDEVMKAFEKSMTRMKMGIENMLRSLGRELIKKLQPKIDAFNTAMEGMGELNWIRLSNILTENWLAILTILGEMATVGGQIIAEKLWAGLTAKYDKVRKTLEFFAKGMELMVSPATALRKILIDSTIPVEDLDAKLKNLAKSLIDLLVPAFEKVNKTIKKSGDLFKDYSSHIFEYGGDEGVEKIKTAWQKFYDWQESEGGQRFLDNAQQATNAVGDVYNNLLGLRRAQIQSELDSQINAVLVSGASEEEKQAKISNLREAAQRKEIAAAKKLKPIKLAMAISDTALAIVGALGNKPWTPFNFALAALVGAAGAAQIATIAAQPYAQGGFVRGNIPSSDTVPAMLTPNEIVSTSAASERFGSEIQRLNQIAEGGFGRSGGDKFYINAIDSQSFLEAVKRQPGKFAEAMQLVRSERYL